MNATAHRDWQELTGVCLRDQLDRDLDVLGDRLAGQMLVDRLGRDSTDLPGELCGGGVQFPGLDGGQRFFRAIDGDHGHPVELAVGKAGQRFDDYMKWVREGIVFQGVSNLYRGLPEGTRFFEIARGELAERVRRGQGAVPTETYRLLLVGTTCYASLKRFAELFETWGGTFVQSTYMVFAGGGFTRGFAYDLARPIESLAEQLLRSAWLGFSMPMFYPQDWLAETVRDWSVDGICFHGVKSCRTTSTGLPDVRDWLRTHAGIPGLFIQSDLVDPRLWSDAQLRNRVDAFIESLAGRKAAEAR
jgi:hypothetical protein